MSRNLFKFSVHLSQDKKLDRFAKYNQISFIYKKYYVYLGLRSRSCCFFGKSILWMSRNFVISLQLSCLFYGLKQEGWRPVKATNVNEDWTCGPSWKILTFNSLFPKEFFRINLVVVFVVAIITLNEDEIRLSLDWFKLRN